MKITSKSNLAFTLIELLVVIAIIAILAGLLMVALPAAVTAGKKAKAQVAVSGLATAAKAYYTEYGFYPSMPATMLAGSFAGYGAGNAYTNMYVTTNLFSNISNTRNIPFYDFPTKDIDAAGTFGAAPNIAYLDPWKKPYRISFDVNYNNQIASPYPPSTLMISAGVIVYSCGPDGKSDDSLTYSTPTSNLGGGNGSSANDKDNVQSW